VTRGQLPQRAGSLGLNDGGTAAAVPPLISLNCAQGHAVPTAAAGTEKVTSCLQNDNARQRPQQNLCGCKWNASFETSINQSINQFIKSRRTQIDSSTLPY